MVSGTDNLDLEALAEALEAKQQRDAELEAEARRIVGEGIWGDDGAAEETERAVAALGGVVGKTFQAHAQAMRAGARCTECALFGCRRGPVPSQLVPNAKLTIVGEAPGTNEVQHGAPFVGASGLELNEALRMGGLEREDCTITNTIACQPPPSESMESFLQKLQRQYDAACARAQKDGQPIPPRSATPIECCAPRLEREIAISNTRTILAVGGKALAAMARYFGVPYAKGRDAEGEIKIATILKQHGAPVIFPEGHRMPDGTTLSESRILCSSLHPAFAMRGARHYKNVILEDIARAARIVRRGHQTGWVEPDYHLFVPPPPRVVPPPNVRIYPDPAQAAERIAFFGALFVAHRAEVTVDIETDSADPLSCKIRCIGFGAKVNGKEHVFVAPFRWRDGRDYWPTTELKKSVIITCREILNNCPLVFHNGAFDTLVLSRAKLFDLHDAHLPSARFMDTMLADRDTDANDLPHDLGAVTRRYFEVPMWKEDADHKNAAGVERDYDLHLYNARDIVTTARLAPVLRSRVAACGTQAQFEMDSALLPIAREMQRLGLPIAEYERGYLSIKFNKLIYELRGRFQAQVRATAPNVTDINPGSGPQLASWLYDEIGLEPVLNTQGYEYEEGDSAATSAQAIIRLIANGVPPNVGEALDTLLEFKACEKIRSTYLDNLRVRPCPEFANLPRVKAARFATNVEAVEKHGAEPEWKVVLPERDLLSMLHPTWKVHTVVSGRWASSPNVQNAPSRAWGGVNLRSVFVAPPGHVLVGADFEQVELRLYALEAQDALVLKALREGLDPHALNAAAMLTKDTSYEGIMREYQRVVSLPADEKKYIRTVAKRFVFLILYGGEEDKLFSVMSSERDKSTGKRVFPNITPDDCARWLENWHRLHPETQAWQRACAAFERSHGWIAEPFGGRKRFFIGGPNKKNAVPNMKIQGAAAHLMNTSMLRLAEAIPFGKWSRWTGLCLQIHDYAGAFVPESRADEAIEIFKKCMYHEVGGMAFPVDKPKATWSLAGQ
jgi:DNA polymerase I-like protein with 3'-5' exonuclease and polymerase domains/uracil-DNA glycosylase